MDDNKPWRGGGAYHYSEIPHYHGDIVRQLFIAIAVLIGLSIPFSGDIATALYAGAPIIVVLVILAGLTHPHGSIVLIFDALAALAGFVLIELTAIAEYQQNSLALFAVHEFIAILFIVALYFSAKNVRALLTHKIGKGDPVGEFDDTSAQQ